MQSPNINNYKQIITNLINLLNDYILTITPYKSGEIRQLLGQINRKYVTMVFRVSHNQFVLDQFSDITKDIVMDTVDQLLFIAGYQNINSLGSNLLITILKINTILINYNFTSGLIPYIDNSGLITVLWS